METAFKIHCLHNSFFDTSDKTEIAVPKMGAIPIGHVRRRYLAGIISVGEAGLIQPPLLGSAFNEVLEYCQEVCSYVSQVMHDTSGIPEHPSYRYPLLKRMQDRLQLHLIRALLNGNVEAFDRLVRTMSKLPLSTVYDFCSNELTWTQILQTIIKLPLYMARPTNISSALANKRLHE